MQIKTAILVDGGWMALELSKFLKVKFASAEQVYKNAVSVLQKDEFLYRMFYYDANPYNGEQENPVSGKKINFSEMPGYSGRINFFEQLNKMPQVALRVGTLNFRGWKLVDSFYNKLLAGETTTNTITESDIKPNFMQKGVDMRIGIDIASLVFKKLVDRIILFCGDTDMVPAMKLARVEGVQIAVVQMGTKKLTPKLIEDSDFLRILTPRS